MLGLSACGSTSMNQPDLIATKPDYPKIVNGITIKPDAYLLCAKLSQTYLVRADLPYAILSGAELRCADLSGATLDVVKLH